MESYLMRLVWKDGRSAVMPFDTLEQDGSCLSHRLIQVLSYGRKQDVDLTELERGDQIVYQFQYWNLHGVVG